MIESGREDIRGIRHDDGSCEAEESSAFNRMG